MRYLAMLCLLVLWDCNQQEAGPSEPVYRPVRAEQVFASGGRRLRTFSGVARAGVESRISFRVGGTIERLPLKVGQRVAAGQLMAELDPRDFALQVEEAQASLVQAEAQARNAAANYERIRGLYENQNVSINELDQARASTESANARVEAIRKSLALARSQLSYTSLKAPVAGRVAQVLAEVGENVSPGQAIAILNAGSNPEVSISVPEFLITEVRQGAAVDVRFDAVPNKTFKGTVTEVGVATERLGTTYPVTLRLDDAGDQIRQGMAAEVGMVFGSDHSSARILVPANAVSEDKAGRFLFVVVAGQQEGLGTVKHKTVETGDITADGLEVISGLEDGEWVVTAGTRFLKDGMTVKLPNGFQEQ